MQDGSSQQDGIIKQGWNKRAAWKFLWKLINEQGGKKRAEGAKCWKLIKEHALLFDTWEYHRGRWTEINSNLKTLFFMFYQTLTGVYTPNLFQNVIWRKDWKIC